MKKLGNRLVLVLVLLLSGCLAVPAGPGTAPASTPGAPPTAAPVVTGEGQGGATEDLRIAIVGDLSHELGIAPEEIRVVSAETLGRAPADSECTQVVESGIDPPSADIQMVLEAQGERYRYLVRGGQVMRCESEEPQAEESGQAEEPTAVPQGETPPADQPDQALRSIFQVQRALEDLAGRIDANIEQIEVISVEEVTWPDASLGCPQPGMMYAQVLTPGMRIVLQAEGETYTYHASERGRVVLCQNGQPGLPDIPVGKGEIDDGEPWMPVK